MDYKGTKMKMTKLLSIAALTSMTMLSACSINIGGMDDEYGNHMSHRSAAEQESRNRQAISTLVPGESLDSVISRMGAADFSEFASKDGEQKTVLYYRTQRLHADGHTTKDECTPIVFIDGKVIGWGESAL